MRSPLLALQQADLPVDSFLAQACDSPPEEIQKVSADTRAWFGVSGGREYFLKWVETVRYPERLAKDAEICSRSLHPALVRLFNVVHTSDGVLLVFEKLKGRGLDDPEARTRFFDLPVEEKLSALRSIFEAMAAIADEGWILVDFYDSTVLYDFEQRAVKLIDFELFERGSGFTLQMERNYGSSRFMAPEEFVKGSWIDAQTNVYNLARYAIWYLSPQKDEDWKEGFLGPDSLAEVLHRATQKQREERHSTVREFSAAFAAACAAYR